MSQPAAFPNPGEVVAGKYRVDRLLGDKGGMGLVVAATQLKLGTSVAIKFLRPAAKDPKRADPISRFLLEAKVIAHLQSEHVVRVSDFDVLPNGMPFMVMEHLKGTDLETLVEERGPLAVETAVSYVLQACEGIAEAHARGIVHRDLKPANLFVVQRPDGSPLVKVLDFGISKITVPSGAGAGLTKPTEGGFASLPYASPEQMHNFRAADQRADLWALGVVLHHLLTGRLPFEGDPMTQIGAVLHLPAIAVRAHQPEILAELEMVILCCLEKDPGRRFASVADLARALEPFAPAHAKASVTSVVETLARQQTMPSVTIPMDPSLTALEGGSSPGQPRRAAPRVAPGAGVVLLVLALGGAAVAWKITPRSSAGSTDAEPAATASAGVTPSATATARTAPSATASTSTSASATPTATTTAAATAGPSTSTTTTKLPPVFVPREKKLPVIIAKPAASVLPADGPRGSDKL